MSNYFLCVAGCYSLVKGGCLCYFNGQFIEAVLEEFNNNGNSVRVIFISDSTDHE